MKPSVIGFDEPFANLDPGMVEQVVDLIRGLPATVILISRKSCPRWPAPIASPFSIAARSLASARRSISPATRPCCASAASTSISTAASGTASSAANSAAPSTRTKTPSFPRSRPRLTESAPSATPRPPPHPPSHRPPQNPPAPSPPSPAPPVPRLIINDNLPRPTPLRHKAESAAPVRHPRLILRLSHPPASTPAPSQTVPAPSRRTSPATPSWRCHSYRHIQFMRVGRHGPE